MSAFPVLNSSAVLQFPAGRTLSYSTDIVQFIDGTEQKYRAYARPIHTWEIKLGALREDEVQRVMAFVQQVRGPLDTFSFTDPWDGVVYPSCSLAGETATAEFLDLSRARTRVVIRENRG